MFLSAKLNYLSLKKRIPLSATFEITHRCCFNCRHCYLTNKKQCLEKKELSFKDYENIFKQIKKLGVYSISLTGGEPFLKKDFFEIATLAKKEGFEVIIFSSLYLANEEKLKKLKDIGIKKLEVSLYGFKKTFEMITRVKGSYDKVIKNLKIAKKLNFKIRIKTPLMALNSKEIPKLKKFSDKNNFSLIIDPYLTIKNNKEEQENFLKPKKNDFNNLFKQKWFFIEENKYSFKDDSLPLCGAMSNTLSFDPYGNVLPCIQMPKKMGNIKNTTIKKIWYSKKALSLVKLLKQKPDKCKNCSLFSFCSRCPGISYIKGDILKVDKETCFIAKLTKENFKK